MTENEAIEEFKECLRIIEKCYRGENETHKQALEIGVKALEKQIPKKTITDDRYIMYICPCCNDFIKVSHKYCPNCGQKLNWESDEE